MSVILINMPSKTMVRYNVTLTQDEHVLYKSTLGKGKHSSQQYRNAIYHNLAERDLRPAKVKLKVSNCFSYFEGAEIYVQISSFVSTARKYNRNVYSELYTTLSGQNFISG